MPLSGHSALQGKIPRPVRHELARPELLGQLEEHQGNLIALIAPAGYGKTTLLAQHARRYEGRVVWLSLGEDDADPLSLGAHLVASLQRIMPTLALSEWHRLRDLGGAAEGLAAALAHDLNGSTTNFELILDGSEVLGGVAERWLSRWLSELTEGHRLLLAGRSELLGLPQRVARGDALLIGLHELAFSAAQTAACLSELQTPLSAQEVHTRLEGWPVGVALVGSGAAPQLTPADLIHDVLERLPPDLKRSLPEASVLEVWSEETAAQAEIVLPPDWLREVRQAGLPLIPLGGSYRPHQLLREVLAA